MLFRRRWKWFGGTTAATCGTSGTASSRSERVPHRGEAGPSSVVHPDFARTGQRRAREGSPQRQRGFFLRCVRCFALKFLLCRAVNRLETSSAGASSRPGREWLTANHAPLCETWNAIFRIGLRCICSFSCGRSAVLAIYTFRFLEGVIPKNSGSFPTFTAQPPAPAAS